MKKNDPLLEAKVGHYSLDLKLQSNRLGKVWHCQSHVEIALSGRRKQEGPRDAGGEFSLCDEKVYYFYGRNE